MGHTACTEPQCLYKGALYRTACTVSVPVQGCTLPLLYRYNSDLYLLYHAAFNNAYIITHCQEGKPRGKTAYVNAIFILMQSLPAAPRNKAIISTL
jgi:hypothetical protein